jgi:hypothetical protein
VQAEKIDHFFALLLKTIIAAMVATRIAHVHSQFPTVLSSLPHEVKIFAEGGARRAIHTSFLSLLSRKKPAVEEIFLSEKFPAC